jgi:Mg2+ and Co2+ transporter CorA
MRGHGLPSSPATPYTQDMIKDTLDKIEQRLVKSAAMKPENKDAIRELLGELREEISELAETRGEQADSIAGFVESSTREATREEQDPELLDLSLKGLQQSIREFEVSHPRLTGVVNRIFTALSDMGI